MIIREPSLPPGWYPRSAGEIKRFLEKWKPPAQGESGASRKDGGAAAISPHAGWYYSGAV
ncbi:MAG: AmmeMemoRadiSam system protein B, partial [Treponema sp.]|nr:AmmeMemoRadiSam system protein B [Treponema sp.]